jgi:hypothetical protein
MGFFNQVSNALASIDPTPAIQPRTCKSETPAHQSSKAVTNVLQSDVGKAAAIAALAYVNPFTSVGETLAGAQGAAEAQVAY